MWKIQHSNGRKEIDELHVPLGTPIKLQMTSEDVIHSFFVPAFRLKQDVVPGRYSEQWFTPTQLGEYHLFCAEYCGTSHALMGGRVVVMSPGDYAKWSANAALDDLPEAAGARLFTAYGCIACHGQQAPTLAGIFNKEQLMQDGQRVKADEAYLRESILAPRAKIVAGYGPLMPSYDGQLSEEQLFDLIAYIKSIQSPAPGTAPAAAPPPAPGRRCAMTTARRSIPPPPHLRRPAHHLHEHGTTLRSWLLTTDHKRIALLYLGAITIFFAIGGAAATLIRLELFTPEADLLKADTYNRMFTIHGIIMVWFFLIPSIPAVLGNFLIPMMIGARDMAFPKLNLLSWYLFIIGGFFTFLALVVGGVDTGWTFYTPLSTTYANGYVVLVVVGIFIAGFSSILTGVNFIVSIHMLRAPGLTWFRLPLFIWSNYATSIILVLATPVLAITLALLGIERVFHVGIFNPALGGDPILFQHLFWFYNHPAVYIMILPGMAVISEVITCFARKRVFGYVFIAFASLAIALVGFLVWGHHMFVSGQSVYGGLVFSLLSYLVAIPSAIKVFNWTATLYKGSIQLDTPMLYCLGFIGLFTLGGMTGIFLAAISLDVHLTDTYFVIAHFHYIMVGGMVMAFLGGIHYWFPKMFGRMYPEWWGRFSALFIFLGFNLTFFPQFILGFLGMPRRYATYPPEFQTLNVLSTAGASILAVGYVLPLLYLLWAMKYGPKAPPNPWRATGLEWQTPSPPPTDKFETTPIVTRIPYDYPNPGDRKRPPHLKTANLGT